MGAWNVPDSDGVHGWQAYKARDPKSAIRERRERSRGFWVD